MKNNSKPVSRKDEIVIQELDGEVLIYDLRSNKAFCLNATSAAIWKLCDGGKSVADIAGRVAKDFKASNSEDLVWLALDQLNKEKLISDSPDLGTRFEGMSRRQIIKKIGLGSLVALPVVAGLVAPPAVLAQTACGTTCHCDDQAAYAAGAICMTTGGGIGTPCPATPPGCTVCRSIAGGINSPGNCFTS